MKQFNIFGEVEEVNERGEVKEKYTKKIETPIYEITGIKPHVRELYDKSKTNRLITEINAADIPEDIKVFLREAATRHTVFDYSKVAEYYAHASKEVQELMERSALVIIDFEKSILLGYTKLSDKLTQEFLNDFGDGE